MLTTGSVVTLRKEEEKGGERHSEGVLDSWMGRIGIRGDEADERVDAPAFHASSIST